MALIDRNALLDKVQTFLLDIPGVTQVETEVGGEAEWLLGNNQQWERSYWNLDLRGWDLKDAAAGGYAKQNLRLQIEGWTPWSYRAPKTSRYWRATVDAVAAALIAQRSVGLLATDLGLPQAPQEDYETFQGAGGAQEFVICHHVLLTCDLRLDFPYGTQ